MKKIIYTFAIIGFLGCSSDSPDDLDLEPVPVIATPTNPGTPVTYTANIKSIIDANCISCHSNPPTNGASTNLTIYQNVNSLSATILNRINKNTGESGAMPLGGPKLSPSQITLFQQWINDGLLEN